MSKPGTTERSLRTTSRSTIGTHPNRTRRRARTALLPARGVGIARRVSDELDHATARTIESELDIHRVSTRAGQAKDRARTVVAEGLVMTSDGASRNDAGAAIDRQVPEPPRQDISISGRGEEVLGRRSDIALPAQRLPDARRDRVLAVVGGQLLLSVRPRAVKKPEA